MKYLITIILMLTLFTGCGHPAYVIPSYKAWVQERVDKAYGKGFAYVKIHNQTKRDYNIIVEDHIGLTNYKSEHHLKPDEHVYLKLESGEYAVHWKTKWWDTTRRGVKVVKLYANKNVRYMLYEHDSIFNIQSLRIY